MRAVLHTQSRSRRDGRATTELTQVVEVDALPETDQLVRVGALEYFVTGVVWDLIISGPKDSRLQPRIYAERQVP